MEKIAILGLGVVGLELAIHLAPYHQIQGFDIDKQRIKDLSQFHDIHQNFDSMALKISNISFHSNAQEIKQAHIFIITVPSDLNTDQSLNLNPLKNVSKLLGTLLKPQDIVIIESSIYPKTCEDIIIPILEKYSGFKINCDFFIAYSPERYSPKDQDYQLEKITKVLAVSDHRILERVTNIYQQVYADTYIAPNIAVAECSKMLENIQRDINIALMNEFSKICHSLDISLHEVIKASSSKKNFCPFQPGFVGGYCIPVNPIYMMYQARQHNIHPKLMQAARDVNESMPEFILNEFLKIYFKKIKHRQHPKIGLFGLGFKPNLADMRNSISLKFMKLIQNYDLDILVHDPFPHKTIHTNSLQEMQNLDICILLVKHQAYIELGLEYFVKCAGNEPIIMDVAKIFAESPKPNNLVYWLL